jgi:hypothetical protein
MNISHTTPGMLRRLALVGVLTLALLGLTVPAASAGEFEDISTKRGAVAFQPDGDWIFAIDNKRDGIGIEANIYWKPTPTSKRKRVASVRDRGAGGVAETKQVDLREGTIVELEMCYFRDSGLIKCSKLQKAVA